MSIVKEQARKFVQEYGFLLKWSESPSDPYAFVSDKFNYSVQLDDQGAWVARWHGRVLARCEFKEYAQAYCVADLIGAKL